MKRVLAFALFAGLLTLGACAHADEMAMLATSALSVADINGEIDAISAEAYALRQGGDPLRGVPLASGVNTAPVNLYVADSNGVLLTAYTPGDARGGYSSTSFGASRPFAYARLEALAKRHAALYAELRQRGLPQQ
jgi:hypothetical protein